MEVLLNIEIFLRIKDQIEMREEMFSHFDDFYYEMDGVDEDISLYQEDPEKMDKMRHQEVL